MAINYTDLRTELLTDPQSLGYAQYVSSGNDVALADLLNEKRAGVAYKIDRETVKAYEIFESVDKDELFALSNANNTKFQLILGMQDINLKGANTRASLGAIFGTGNAPLSRTAIISLQKRNGSRAEVLFGDGTSITISDISFALRGVR
jgi:hypothetical protein